MSHTQSLESKRPTPNPKTGGDPHLFTETVHPPVARVLCYLSTGSRRFLLPARVAMEDLREVVAVASQRFHVGRVPGPEKKTKKKKRRRFSRAIHNKPGASKRDLRFGSSARLVCFRFNIYIYMYICIYNVCIYIYTYMYIICFIISPLRESANI